MQQNLQNIRQTSPLSNNDSSSGTNINILNTNNNNSNYNNNNNLLGGNNSTSQVPQPAIACFEVSAKDNIDVDKLFTYVADRIVAARREVILDFDAVDAQSPSGSIRGWWVWNIWRWKHRYWQYQSTEKPIWVWILLLGSRYYLCIS